MPKDKHKHVWKWAHEEDNYKRVIYDDNTHEADVICEGCGVQIPGIQYCTIVKELRWCLDLGEEEHIDKLKSALDDAVIANKSL